MKYILTDEEYESLKKHGSENSESIIKDYEYWIDVLERQNKLMYEKYWELFYELKEERNKKKWWWF